MQEFVIVVDGTNDAQSCQNETEARNLANAKCSRVNRPVVLMQVIGTYNPGAPVFVPANPAPAPEPQPFEFGRRVRVGISASDEDFDDIDAVYIEPSKDGKYLMCHVAENGCHSFEPSEVFPI